MFLGQSLFFNFLQMVMFTTLFQRCSTFRESTLKMTTLLQINVEIDNVDVDSTLFSVINSYVDVRNVVSTLIWRCATSRCYIILWTTLKQRWCVYWVLTQRTWTFNKILTASKCYLVGSTINMLTRFNIPLHHLLMLSCFDIVNRSR